METLKRRDIRGDTIVSQKEDEGEENEEEGEAKGSSDKYIEQDNEYNESEEF